MSYQLSASGLVVFDGENIYEPYDLSALAWVKGHVVLGSDEGNVIQILEKKNADTFSLKCKYTLPDGKETKRNSYKGKTGELDIEGIASQGGTVYVVGSHSKKRKKVEAGNPEGRSYEENRKRLAEVADEKGRGVLIKLKLDDEGKIRGKPEEKGIQDVMEAFDELKLFRKIPSKENGIDIEGIAVWDKTLYIGFRAPVLRENWVPVLLTTFEHPKKAAELRFVNLGGLGIRDIVAVDEGSFLLLAGPMGDGPGGYHLYEWNGLDCVPGKKGAKGKVCHIGEIPTASGAKAEGLTVLNGKQSGLLKLLVVFDGPRNGAPISFELRR